MPYEFYVKVDCYDDDFMFYIGEQHVSEGHTIKFIGDTPFEAYSKFEDQTKIYHRSGPNLFGSHIDYFRKFFYEEIRRLIVSNGTHVHDDSLLDFITMNADGCFECYHGGNQEFTFGVRKVFDFKVKTYSDFKTQYLQIELERTKYLEKMLAEYNTEKFFPALDALESASHDVVKQLGLADKQYLKQVLKVAREINPRIVPTLPYPNAGT